VLLRPRQRILRSLVGVSYPFVLHDLTARIVFSVCVYGWALAEVVLQLRNRRGRRRQRGWTSWPTVASIWIAVGLAMRELRQGRRYRGVLRTTPWRCLVLRAAEPDKHGLSFLLLRVDRLA
jgi:hypothetical protein